MKLVAVFEVEGIDSTLVDPQEVVDALCADQDADDRLGVWFEGASCSTVRAEWHDTIRRSSVDELLDDEDE